MARNTTGLRRGGPGRPKGAQNKVPHDFKASIRRVYEEVASSDPTLIRRALVRGLQAAPPKSFQYLQILSHYVDGKPAETVKLQGKITGPPIILTPPGSDDDHGDG